MFSVLAYFDFYNIQIVTQDADYTAASTQRLLLDMHAVWDAINAIFDRMVEKCDPYIYFNRVRPYINGWKNNPAMPGGLIYDGVARFDGKPQAIS